MVASGRKKRPIASHQGKVEVFKKGFQYSDCLGWWDINEGYPVRDHSHEKLTGSTVTPRRAREAVTLNGSPFLL